MAITAKQIKRLREDRNMTQDEFAELLSITRVALHNLEAGKSSPGNRVRKELEKLLPNSEHDAINFFKFNSPTVSVDPNLSEEDREFESELITYYRLLDRDSRLRHLKAVASDAAMNAKCRLQNTLRRK